MNVNFKKILISSAYLICISAYADTIDRRITILETELMKLKELRAVDLKTSEEKFAIVEAKSIPQSSQPSSDTTFKFYGMVRLDGSLDFKATTTTPFVSNQTNVINHIPGGSRSAVTVTGSRLGMDVSKKVNDNDVKTKLEMDFWDGLEGNGKLRIRHAYINFNHWLIGQTWSNMSNLETNTESVDYTLFMGYSWTRTPQIRYNFNLTPAHNLKFSAEYVDSRASELPAITAKYTYNQDGFLVVAQGFANEKRETITAANGNEKDIDKWGWGIGAGLKYKLSSTNTTQAHIYHVKGDQKFVSYTGGDFSVSENKHYLDQNYVTTYVLGYSHKISEKWRSNFAVSLIDYDDSTQYAKSNPTNNKQVSDISANIFYTPITSVDVGLEYHHGKREQFDGEEYKASRLNFVTTYKF